MSALAARRAALAAKQVEQESSPVVTPNVSRPSSRQATRAPSPSPSLPESDTSVEVETSAPSSKRQKIQKTPKLNDKPRYFVAKEDEAPPRRRRKAFSPSAPQEDVTSGSSAFGSEDEEDDESSVDGAAEPWSGVQSPRMDAGPSRPTSQSLRPCSSRFEPVEDVNFVKLDGTALQNAGLSSMSGVIVSLGSEDTLAIAGAYLLTPLRGTISLLSTTVPSSTGTSETYPVYAPTSHPVPVLAPTNPPIPSESSSALAKLALPKSLLADKSRTLFVIQESNSGIRDLHGDIVPGFNNIWASSRNPWGLQGVVPMLGSSPTVAYPHTTPASWTKALASLAPAADSNDLDSPPPEEPTPIVVVKGPKRSGKSSLARAALNTLLSTYQKVAWVETDLGQAEFGCGGVVGLWVLERPVFGPPFTHPSVPLRAHYVGELSPQPRPDEYMAAVHHLISFYQGEVQTPLSSFNPDEPRRTDVIPLVVNTQGWTKGLGEELMQVIEMVVLPTHIFAFEDGSVQQPLPSSPSVFQVEPAPSSPLQARYTAADMRALSTIAYLHSHGDKWDFSAPLLAMKPWTLSLGDTVNNVYLIGEGADAILPHDLPLALNGSLVGLLASEPEEELYIPGRQPSMENATFLGLALIRAVRADDEGIALQLITPLRADLARVTAIVRNGAMELPTCGMLDWRDRSDEGLAGVRWEDVPFFEVSGNDAIGGDRRRFRKNLQRKNQG